MKKILLFLLLCASVLSYANDIIVTNDEKKLEVKITSVTKEQITYKMPDYIDGPDFIIETSEISTIIFENGQVKTYHHEKQQEYTSSEIKNTNNPKDSKIDQIKIVRHGNTYYYGSKVMPGRVFNNEQYLNFLNNNNYKAYETFSSGLVCAAAGYGCLIGGGLCLGIGTIAAVIPGGYDNIFAWSLFISGYTIGGMAIIAAVPLTAVGFSKMHKSADIYNTSCTKRETAQLSLGLTAGPNGLGLAFSF